MELDLLEESLGYTFRNKDLLQEALMHTTYVNEHKDLSLKDNQRLEFLGDTVINTVITTRLFLQFPEEKEGALTKKRAELISEGALFKIARLLGLGRFLFLGKGEEMDSGRKKASLIADAYEAVVGAIYLDSSFETALHVVENHYEKAMGTFEDISITDYKSLLLEYCQSQFKTMPKITVVDERGPEHDKEFEVSVTLNERSIGLGRGRNKKRAAQVACKEALRSLDYPLS